MRSHLSDSLYPCATLLPSISPLLPFSVLQDQDKLVIELVLWLIRNLLCIPDGKPSSSVSSTGEFENLHENFILMLSKEYVTDVLLHLAECVGLEGNR